MALCLLVMLYIQCGHDFIEKYAIFIVQSHNFVEAATIAHLQFFNRSVEYTEYIHPFWLNRASGRIQSIVQISITFRVHCYAITLPKKKLHCTMEQKFDNARHFAIVVDRATPFDQNRACHHIHQLCMRTQLNQLDAEIEMMIAAPLNESRGQSE